jgi:hypothetical protein
MFKSRPLKLHSFNKHTSNTHQRGVLISHEIFLNTFYNSLCYGSPYSDGLWVDWPGFDSWKIYFSLYSVQTGFEAHPASYIMGTGSFFLGGKAAGA